MKAIEFHTDHSTGQAMFRIAGEPQARELTQSDREIIEPLLERSQVLYPEQYKALATIYSRYRGNARYYEFLMARRIINCCFGEIDAQPDIDLMGNYNFEYVKCPILAECLFHNVICHPKMNTTLSGREREIMRFYMDGYHTSEIAELLCLSGSTVANHRKNSYRKLKIHTLGEFVNFAHKHKIYDHGQKRQTDRRPVEIY